MSSSSASQKLPVSKKKSMSSGTPRALITGLFDAHVIPPGAAGVGTPQRMDFAGVDTPQPINSAGVGTPQSFDNSAVGPSTQTPASPDGTTALRVSRSPTHVPVKLADITRVQSEDGLIHIRMAASHDPDVKRKYENLRRLCPEKKAEDFRRITFDAIPERATKILYDDKTVQMEDFGVLPEVLQLLVEQQPGKSLDALLSEYSVGSEAASHNSMLQAIMEIAKFISKYSRLPPLERLYFQLDSLNLTRLPTFRIEENYYVLAVPLAHRPTKLQYLDKSYLEKRFANLAVLLKKSALIMCVPFLHPKDGYADSRFHLLSTLKLGGSKRSLVSNDDERSNASSVDSKRTCRSDISSVPSTAGEAGGKSPVRRSARKKKAPPKKEPSDDPEISRRALAVAQVQIPENMALIDIDDEVADVLANVNDSSDDEPENSGSVLVSPSQQLVAKVNDWRKTIGDIDRPIDPTKAFGSPNFVRSSNYPTEPKRSDAGPSQLSSGPIAIALPPLGVFVEPPDQPIESVMEIDTNPNVEPELDYSPDDVAADESVSNNVSQADDGSEDSRDAVVDPPLPPVDPIEYSADSHRLHLEVEKFTRADDARKLRDALPTHFVPAEVRLLVQDEIPQRLGNFRQFRWFKDHVWSAMDSPYGQSNAVADDVFSSWLPPGVQHELEMFISRVQGWGEKDFLQPAHMMAQVPSMPQYYQLPDDKIVDSAIKAGIQSYEHNPHWVESTLASPSNLFHPLVHIRCDTQIFRGVWLDELKRYFKLPAYRIVNSLAQAFLVFGATHEQVVVSHYLFKNLTRYRDNGRKDTFFRLESQESFDAAANLWAILTAPPTGTYKHPVSFLRIFMVPYMVRFLATVRLCVNPAYQIDSDNGEAANWQQPISEMTPRREAEELLTIDGITTLGAATANAKATVDETVQPVLFPYHQLLEGEGTAAHTLIRSDRPDLSRAPMRAPQTYLNCYGEAITNAYVAVSNNLEKVFSWETFKTPRNLNNKDVRSQILRHEAVFIGGQSARALAIRCGSSYIGDKRMNIRDIFLLVFCQKSALWRKNGTRAAMCIIMPDDSGIFDDDVIVDEPSRLHGLGRDQLIVGTGCLVFHIAEILRSVEITPVFVQHLPRVKHGDAPEEWRRKELLQRAFCSYYNKCAWKLNAPFVDLRDLVPNCYNNSFYWGQDLDDIMYGPGCQVDRILERIDQVVNSRAVQDFFTPEGQLLLYHAESGGRSHAYKVFEWFKDFLIIFTGSSNSNRLGGDWQVKLHYTGSFNKLLQTSETPGEFQHRWRMKYNWVREMIRDVTFHLDNLTYGFPTNVDEQYRHFWATERKQLNLPDHGVTLFDLILEQPHVYKRGIDRIWRAGAQRLELSSPTPVNSLTALTSINELDAEFAPFEFTGLRLSEILTRDRQRWAEITQPPEPLMLDSRGLRMATGPDPIAEIIIDHLRRWFRFQDSRDVVEFNLATDALQPAEARLFAASCQFWQIRLGGQLTPEVRAFLTRDTIRRHRGSDFYSAPYRNAYSVESSDAYFRGFFNLNQPLTARLQSVVVMPAQAASPPNQPAAAVPIPQPIARVRSPTVPPPARIVCAPPLTNSTTASNLSSYRIVTESDGTPRVKVVPPGSLTVSELQKAIEMAQADLRVLEKAAGSSIGKGRGRTIHSRLGPLPGPSSAPTPRDQPVFDEFPDVRDELDTSYESDIAPDGVSLRPRGTGSKNRVEKEPTVIPVFSPTASRVRTDGPAVKKTDGSSSVKKTDGATIHRRKASLEKPRVERPVATAESRQIANAEADTSAASLVVATSRDAAAIVDQVVTNPSPNRFEFASSINRASRLGHSDKAIEDAIKGEVLLPYPLNKVLTDSRFLKYCSPPETAVSMGSDVSILVENYLAAELPGPKTKWNLARVTGKLYVWYVRRRRHAKNQLALTRDDISRILSLVEEAMESLFPESYPTDSSEPRAIECD